MLLFVQKLLFDFSWEQTSLQDAVEKLVKKIEKQMKAWEKKDHPERFEMPLD